MFIFVAIVRRFNLAASANPVCYGALAATTQADLALCECVYLRQVISLPWTCWLVGHHNMLHGTIKETLSALSDLSARWMRLPKEEVVGSECHRWDVLTNGAGHFSLTRPPWSSESTLDASTLLTAPLNSRWPPRPPFERRVTIFFSQQKPLIFEAVSSLSEVWLQVWVNSGDFQERMSDERVSTRHHWKLIHHSYSTPVGFASVHILSTVFLFFSLVCVFHFPLSDCLKFFCLVVSL